jgi:hypothetical protein
VAASPGWRVLPKIDGGGSGSRGSTWAQHGRLGVPGNEMPRQTEMRNIILCEC